MGSDPKEYSEEYRKGWTACYGALVQDLWVALSYHPTIFDPNVTQIGVAEIWARLIADVRHIQHFEPEAHRRRILFCEKCETENGSCHSCGNGQDEPNSPP